MIAGCTVQKVCWKHGCLGGFAAGVRYVIVLEGTISGTHKEEQVHGLGRSLRLLVFLSVFDFSGKERVRLYKEGSQHACLCPCLHPVHLNVRHP